MNLISVLNVERFHRFFQLIASDWYSFVICFLYLSAHVQASISTKRVNGGHAYYTIKTNATTTFSGFYVFYIFVWGTDFHGFFLYVSIVKSFIFGRARFVCFASILDVILDGFVFNLASKTLQDAFQEAFQNDIPIWYPFLLIFGCFGDLLGHLKSLENNFDAAVWWSHFGSKSGLVRK